MGQRGEEGEGKWAGHLSFPRESPIPLAPPSCKTAWPEVCVAFANSAGQAFYGFHFSDKRTEAHEGR